MKFMRLVEEQESYSLVKLDDYLSACLQNSEFKDEWVELEQSGDELALEEDFCVLYEEESL